MGARRTKWGVLVTCTLIVCGMGYASWVHKSGDEVRERLELALLTMKRDERAPVYRTAPLWGETIDEVAFEQYALAGAALAAKALPKSLGWNAASGEIFLGGKTASPERAKELREAWAPAIEDVRAGAHCRLTQPGTIRILPGKTTGPGKAPAILVPNLDQVEVVLLCELQLLAREARTRDFVGLWMDAVTFAVDGLSQSGGTARVRLYLNVLTDDLLATLSELDLQRLDGFLANADPLVGALADPNSLLMNTVQIAVEGSRKVSREPMQLRLSAWQHGFDPYRADLEGFDELLRLRAMLEPIAKDGGQREAQWSAYRSARRERQTFTTSLVDDRAENGERWQREALTQLRLLRLAVAFHRGVEVPQLADPFASAPLQVQIEDDSAVLRSARTFDRSQRIARRR